MKRRAEENDSDMPSYSHFKKMLEEAENSKRMKDDNAALREQLKAKDDQMRILLEQQRKLTEQSKADNKLRITLEQELVKEKQENMFKQAFIDDLDKKLKVAQNESVIVVPPSPDSVQFRVAMEESTALQIAKRNTTTIAMLIRHLVMPNSTIPAPMKEQYQKVLEGTEKMLRK